LVPLAAYACLSPVPSARGLLLRAFGTGLAFAVCTWCRGGCLLLLAGYALALAIGGWRINAAPRWRALLVFAGCGLLLGAPYLLLRSVAEGVAQRTLTARGIAGRPQQHAFWLGIWSGLGDFDRTKGYRWRDRSAGAAIEAAGGPAFTHSYYDERGEPYLRRLVLDDIRKDPLWYAGILAQRTWATLVLRRLWPWPPLSELSFEPSTSPNEGVIDNYYRLTATADTLGAGLWTAEAPVPLLLLPGWLLLVRWLRLRDRRTLGDLGVLACLAAATLALPVLVTTASALELECFMLVYFLGAAFAADAAVAWLRRC
jgi:hypothetical protein